MPCHQCESVWNNKRRRKVLRRLALGLALVIGQVAVERATLELADPGQACKRYPNCDCEQWTAEHATLAGEHALAPQEHCWMLLWAEGYDLAEFLEPEVELPVNVGTGPVIVSIEYRIADADVVAFLNAMAERRRVRRRNGARGWSLLRDLGDPQLWVERYRTPTWTEYLRHNQRFTRDDAVIGERIRALHQGPPGPRVRRLIERQPGFQPHAVESDAKEWAAPLTDQSRLS